MQQLCKSLERYILTQDQQIPRFARGLIKYGYVHMTKYCLAIRSNKVLIYVTTWMNLEDTICEKGQSQKIIYCMNALIWGVQRNQNNTDRKYNGGC